MICAQVHIHHDALVHSHTLTCTHVNMYTGTCTQWHLDLSLGSLVGRGTRLFLLWSSFLYLQVEYVGSWKNYQHTGRKQFVPQDKVVTFKVNANSAINPLGAQSFTIVVSGHGIKVFYGCSWLCIIPVYFVVQS